MKKTDLSKNSLSSNSIVVAAKDQISRDLEGEAVILNINSGAYFGLENVGARIWSLIQEPRAVSDVRDIILDEYEVEFERCEQDLLTLLHGLAAKGLIDVKDEKTA